MGTITYHTLPVPAFDAFTARVPAGAVTFGVEYRKLDETTILAAYGPNAREKFGNVAPAGMGAVVEEDGVSLHVYSTATSEERLRFDCFDDAPHYHLLAPAESRNVVIEHDTASHGPVLAWALAQLRTNLPALLREAGASREASALDQETVAAAVDEVDRLAHRMVDIGRPVAIAEESI